MSHFSPEADALLREWLASPTWYKETDANESAFLRFAVALIKHDLPHERMDILEIERRITSAVRHLRPDTDESVAHVRVYNLVEKLGIVYQFLQAQREMGLTTG